MASARLVEQRWLHLAAPQPALILGVLLMHWHGVSPAEWGQNLAGLLLTLVCAGLSLVRFPSFKLAWPAAVAAAAFVLLLATFADAGSDGVHRWVRLGPLRFHAAAICLPLLIIALGKTRSLAEGKSLGWIVPLLGTGAMALLALQPDAAQATALAGALLILLFWRRHPTWATWSAALLSVACVAGAWKRPDPLLPVRYVEGIVGLAAQSGMLCLLAALVSLALLPLPFLCARLRDGSSSTTALALGVYFSLQLVMPWLGFFPVPLLGFGLSPIIGYFCALGWLVVASRSLPDPTRAAKGLWR